VSGTAAESNAGSSYRMRRRGSALKPSLTCPPWIAVTMILIGPWANSSPTGVCRSRFSSRSIVTIWPGLRGYTCSMLGLNVWSALSIPQHS